MLTPDEWFSQQHRQRADRCKAEAFVRSVCPNLDDVQVRAVADKILKAFRGIKNTGVDHADP